MTNAHPVLAGVSRETMERLRIFVRTLEEWAPRINLVAKSSLDDVWGRHIADSAQIAELGESARTWLDFGSGAGLPGLVVAALLPETQVTLVESDTRKCAFLSIASQRMGVSTVVKNERIENLPGSQAAVISARAVAPLDTLLEYAEPHRTTGTVCLFLKGENVDQELTAARKRWKMTVERIQSRTSKTGSILRIGAFSRA